MINSYIIYHHQNNENANQNFILSKYKIHSSVFLTVPLINLYTLASQYFIHSFAPSNWIVLPADIEDSCP